MFNGYPAVGLHDRSGVIPFSISHRGDQMITSRRPGPVGVPHGGVAFVLLNQYRCDLRNLRAATVVRLGSPAASTSIRLANHYRQPHYCGRGDPGSTLAVSPLEPSVRAALKH